VQESVGFATLLENERAAREEAVTALESKMQLNSLKLTTFGQKIQELRQGLVAREDLEGSLLLIQQLQDHAVEETMARKNEFASLSKNVQEMISRSLVQFKEELTESTRDCVRIKGVDVSATKCHIRTAEINKDCSENHVLEADYDELRQRGQTLFEQVASLRSGVDDSVDAASPARTTKSKDDKNIVMAIETISTNMASLLEMLAKMQVQVDCMQIGLSGLEGEVNKIQAAPETEWNQDALPASQQNTEASPWKSLPHYTTTDFKTAPIASHADLDLHFKRLPYEQFGSMALAVENAFLSFCGSGKTSIDGKGFAELAMHCNLVDEKCTPNDMDIIFAKVAEKGQRRIRFQQFASALSYIAQKKSVKLDSVLRAVANTRGPMHNATENEEVRFHTYTGGYVKGGPDSLGTGRGHVPPESDILKHGRDTDEPLVPSKAAAKFLVKPAAQVNQVHQRVCSTPPAKAPRPEYVTTPSPVFLSAPHPLRRSFSLITSAGFR
jgi:hypothetical protein